MKNLLILLILFLTSCSQWDIYNPDFFKYEGPEDLRPFVEEFVQEAADRRVKLRNGKVRIEIVEGWSDARGARGTAFKYNSTIKIDKGWYERWKNEAWMLGSLRVLVFHELGHLLLDRKHYQPNDARNEVVFGDNKRNYIVSIMQKSCTELEVPLIHSDNWQKENDNYWDYLKAELFGFHRNEESMEYSCK